MCEVVYQSRLRACVARHSVGEGRRIHSVLVRSGLDTNAIIGSTLIRMYAKCNSLEEAINVFDRLRCHTITSWGAMMSAYGHHGQGQSTLDLFGKMEGEGVQPDKIIYICVLKACANIKSLLQGTAIHAQIVKCGFDTDVVIGSATIDMYSRCGNVQASRATFDKMVSRNIVSWNTIISCHVQHGDVSSALDLYNQMLEEGLRPNKFIMSSILRGCALLGDYQLGTKIYEQVGKLKLESDSALGNAVVDMYAKCGRLQEAHDMFDSLHSPNLVSWGSLIAGYVQHDCNAGAMKLFISMQHKGIQPNLVTLTCMLKACANVRCLFSGKIVHDYLVRSTRGTDDVVACSLVDMYAKCGGLMDACKLIDGLPGNVTAWGAMMSGCAEHGEPYIVLKLFQKLLQQGVKLNKVLCLCIFQACGSIRLTAMGMLMHSMMVTLGLEMDAVLGSSLVDMYVKCGSLQDAHKLFDQVLHQDVVSWGALIVGYVQQGQDICALRLFEEMERAGIQPNEILYSCVIKACGNLGALALGQLIHDSTIRGDCETDTVLRNSLSEMYSSCGCDLEAQRPYGKLTGQYGIPHSDWRGKGVEPCDISTDACTNGNGLSQVMHGPGVYPPSAVCPNFAASQNLSSWVIDEVGRRGCLFDAGDLLGTMPMLPDDVAWTSFLTSCRTYGNTNLGSGPVVM